MRREGRLDLEGRSMWLHGAGLIELRFFQMPRSEHVLFLKRALYSHYYLPSGRKRFGMMFAKIEMMFLIRPDGVGNVQQLS